MTVPAPSFRKQGDLPLIISKITVIFPIINKRGKVGHMKNEKSYKNHSEILSFRRVKSSSKTLDRKVINQRKSYMNFVFSG